MNSDYIFPSVFPSIRPLRQAKIIEFGNGEKYLSTSRRAHGNSLAALQTRFEGTDISLYVDTTEPPSIEVDDESTGRYLPEIYLSKFATKRQKRRARGKLRNARKMFKREISSFEIIRAKAALAMRLEFEQFQLLFGFGNYI